jgi:maltooligosyltrehalose trehalohydrolase
VAAFMKTTAGKDRITLGSSLDDGRCRFELWAPRAERVEVHFVAPRDRVVALAPAARGYHRAVIDGVESGHRYFYCMNGKDRPDPASRYQPEGVHGSSEIVAGDFAWRDQKWFGRELRDYIIYELHVGTFTPEGTFDAIVKRLDDLKELGVTAIELMPIAQFPGSRNWGYDGVQPFAAQNSYGGPEGLKRLVDACHRSGFAVILDVVYNHLGPEGNYLADFGGYFTQRYNTPWGPAVNFDGPESDEVRNFFVQNALYWVRDCHIDALRLDAVHAILDHSPVPFLVELGKAIHAEAVRLNRRVYLMPESADNDARLLRPRELGGFGLDAQWSDDFHHCVHVLLTGDCGGYYEDYARLDHLAKAFREGFVYSGEYSPFRKRRHGSSSRDISAERFIVFSQNHDQVGNRMRGERLVHLAGFEAAKLAAGAVLLSPFIPLLFMGEEYGERAPFPYFISHGDPGLVEAVRKGRREESRTSEEPPDPQAEATFQSARLNWDLKNKDAHRALLELYRELIRVRKETPSLAALDKNAMEVIAWEKKGLLFVRRWKDDDESFIVFNFNSSAEACEISFLSGGWGKVVDSAEPRWHGKGSAVPRTLDADRMPTLEIAPRSFILFRREAETARSER